MWNTKEKSRYREIKEGLYIVTLNDIVNGDIIIPKGINGKIIYANKQVEADIWFNEVWKYKNKKCLNVDTDFFKPTQFRGVVLTVKAKDFAIKYNYDKHSDIKFDAVRLEGVPYLDLSKVKSYEGQFYRNNEKVKEYTLEDIIQNIEDGFSEFVSKLESRSSTEDDNSDLDYVFTDKAIEEFTIEQQRIVDKFMECTGMWYNFLGGAIEE
ncbi:hypothetical protein ACQKNX_07760 [Lysinibacillus sp. NPDC093712]|uniref:hypothetical protein n=1 Tax=Lysinibacillus sp. NPDC093712 TaxID=3390579 RepID=UPI003D019027